MCCKFEYDKGVVGLPQRSGCGITQYEYLIDVNRQFTV